MFEEVLERTPSGRRSPIVLACLPLVLHILGGVILQAKPTELVCNCVGSNILLRSCAGTLEAQDLLTILVFAMGPGRLREIVHRTYARHIIIAITSASTWEWRMICLYTSHSDR